MSALFCFPSAGTAPRDSSWSAVPIRDVPRMYMGRRASCGDGRRDPQRQRGGWKARLVDAIYDLRRGRGAQVINRNRPMALLFR